jgi:hypothetical protein
MRYNYGSIFSKKTWQIVGLMIFFGGFIMIATSCSNSNSSDVLLGVMSESPNLDLESEMHRISNDKWIDSFINDMLELDIPTIDLDDLTISWYDYNLSETHELNIFVDDSYEYKNLDFSLFLGPIKDLHQILIEHTYFDEVSVVFGSQHFEIAFNGDELYMYQYYSYASLFHDSIGELESTLRLHLIEIGYAPSVRSRITIRFSDVQLILESENSNEITIYNFSCYPNPHMCSNEGYIEIVEVLENYLPGITFKRMEIGQ